MLERERVIEGMKDHLDKIDDQLGLLEAKAERLSAEAKVAYQEQLVNLRKQRQELRDRIKRAENDGKDLLDTVVEQFESTRAALTAGIEELQQQAKE